MNLRRKGACDNESKMREEASPAASAGTGDACVCVCQGCRDAEMTYPSGKG